jgi:hypothetical protein
VPSGLRKDGDKEIIDKKLVLFVSIRVLMIEVFLNPF